MNVNTRFSLSATHIISLKSIIFGMNFWPADKAYNTYHIYMVNTALYFCQLFSAIFFIKLYLVSDTFYNFNTFIFPFIYSY